MVSVQRHDIPDIPDQNAFPYFPELQKHVRVDYFSKLRQHSHDNRHRLHFRQMEILGAVVPFGPNC